MEKIGKNAEAAEHYERTWMLQNQSSPSVGFKLAFNCALVSRSCCFYFRFPLPDLKAKRFVEAIDVCQKVLVLIPDYPNIKSELLDKARASLRP